MTEALSYCGQLVKEQDPDRFLLSMFALPQRREALWALFAFNHEIAKTREVVSETQLGLIRLQWWREAIAKIYDTGEVPDHEILKALAVAIKDYNLQRGQFETLIYAREFDLEDAQPSNLEGLLNYADFTSAPLFHMAVMIAGDEPDMDPVAAVAVNYSLMGLLRAVPFHASQRRCFMPADLMKVSGVTLKQLYDFGKPEAGMTQVVKDVADHFVPGIRTSSRFLQAVQDLSAIYHRQIKGCRYDVHKPRMRHAPAFKEITLLAGILMREQIYRKK